MNTESPVKICAECRHGKFDPPGCGTVAGLRLHPEWWYCTREAVPIVCPITGKGSWDGMTKCEGVRSKEGECGHEGKFWEPFPIAVTCHYA